MVGFEGVRAESHNSKIDIALLWYEQWAGVWIIP